MSTCAFCGDRRPSGRNYLAHRMTPTRVRTVKVCSTCVADAADAGYYVTEREPGMTPHPSRITNIVLP
jgi:hypothetical protein